MIDWLRVFSTATFYLVYFYEDETVSVVKESSIVECVSGKSLEVGKECRVKEKRKVFSGRVVSYGTQTSLKLVTRPALHARIIVKFFEQEQKRT